MNRDADILVVGAGPSGLALALQAHHHGANVRIIERRAEVFRPSRAMIVHPRTLEVLRPLRVTDQLLARADTAPEVNMHLGPREVRVRLDAFALQDSAFPHLTLMRQMDVETVLTQALADRGIVVERGTELIEVQTECNEARATLHSRTGIETLDYRFVAGCDGPESTVRRMAEIGWDGGPYGEEVVLADVELDGDLDSGIAHVVSGRRGLLLLFALGENATWRLLGTRPAGHDTLPYGQPGPPIPLPDLQALVHESGLDAQITDLVWSGRYRLQHRIARQFRQGPLFLVGDAAHAYSPATGQGMNTGIQDAVNLGWKLPFAASASDSPALLDSYDLERRPVVRQVLALTHLAFWAEASTGPLPSLLRGVLAPLGAPAIPTLVDRRRIVARVFRLVSQLDVAYQDSPISVEGVPNLLFGPRPGHRLPDERITAAGREGSLHSLLARPGVHVLLHSGASHLEQLDAGPLATFHRLTSTPGTGLVAVRPDGYVGFRCGTADPTQLGSWLARIGAGCTASATDPVPDRQQRASSRG